MGLFGSKGGGSRPTPVPAGATMLTPRASGKGGGGTIARSASVANPMGRPRDYRDANTGNARSDTGIMGSGFMGGGGGKLGA